MAERRNPCGSTGSGPFARRTFLREFLQEILHEALAQRLGVHSVDDIESITLVGSSAGGTAADAIVSHSDLVAKIRNVILFDGFYGGASTFASWLARDPQRRFVSVHGGGHSTANPARELIRFLTPSLRRSLALNPSGALSEVVRTHRVVIAQTPVEHIAMCLVYYAKVISSLNFPLISAASTAKSPIGTLRAAVSLTVGQPVAATIELSDQPLRDGSRCDDYALELRAGQSVVVDVRGGRSASEGRMPLDVVVQLLDGTQVLAENDDVAGSFRAQLAFVARRSARYTVRVSTHGPWPRSGPYTVLAR